MEKIYLDFVLQIIMITLVTFLILFQDKVIKFERKVWMFIKAFFYALNDVVKERKQKKRLHYKGKGR